MVRSGPALILLLGHEIFCKTKLSLLRGLEWVGGSALIGNWLVGYMETRLVWDHIEANLTKPEFLISNDYAVITHSSKCHPRFVMWDFVMFGVFKWDIWHKRSKTLSPLMSCFWASSRCHVQCFIAICEPFSLTVSHRLVFPVLLENNSCSRKYDRVHVNLTVAKMLVGWVKV